MKLHKIIKILVLTFMILLMANISNAYTVTIDNVKAKQGEEFTITLNVSEETPLADGHIKYDSSKVEFIKTMQNGMNAAVKDDGDVAWMYIDESSFSGIDSIKGVNKFEFVFKSKTSNKFEIAFEDLEFVDTKGNEYTMDNLENSITKIQVNKSNTKIIVLVSVIVVALASIVIFKIKKK